MTQGMSVITFQNPEPFQTASEHQSAKGHLTEAGNGAILQLEQFGPDQSVADGNREHDSEFTSISSRPISSDHLRDVRTTLHEEEGVSVPEAQGTRREIHLVTPLTMIAALLVAFFMAIAHHFYYHSLVGKVVGGSYDQQKTRFLGNFFPIVVQLCLAKSIDIAYAQWLFLSLMSRPVAIDCVDAAYSAPGSLLFILNFKMLRKLPVLSILALISCAIIIPTSLTTPGTLVVTPSDVTSFTWMEVPVLAIASTNMSQSNYYHVSRPAAGPDSPNNSSLLFLGPRTIISRLLTAASAFGQILALPAPFVKSSYQIQFEGPMVQCREANLTEAQLIQNAIAAQMQPKNNVQQTYNSYLAYVPDLSTPDRLGNLSDRTNHPTSGSNQLWLAFQTNSTEWVFPKCNNPVYQVCQLVEASYDLTITFQDGKQNIAGYPPATSKPIDYPVVDLSQPSDPVQLAYSAYMWELSNQITGSIGLYNDSSSSPNSQAEYLDINANIENTALLGSVDLNCSFALDAIFSSHPWLNPPSLQRAQDIHFAGGRNLADLIHELAFNLTVSLMNDDLLAPGVRTNVTMVNTVDLYQYRSLSLLLAYGMALLVATGANVLGIIAILRNGVTIDRKWSSIVSATTGITLLEEKDRNRRASQPIPDDAKSKEVIIVRLVDGGFTFKLSHVAVASGP